MRYTAFAAIVIGVVVACYAGYQYASGGPPGEAQSPSATSLALPLAFAALLVSGGVLMWLFTGKGYTESKGSPARRPRREAGVLPVTDAKHDSPRG